MIDISLARHYEVSANTSSLVVVADRFDEGAKGMLSLDTRLTGNTINVRPSMVKFTGSRAPDLELCGVARRPLPMYLNRQIIKIMEDMGTSEEFFVHQQAKAIEKLRVSTKSPAKAANFVQSQSIGSGFHFPWFLKKLNALKLPFLSDTFLRNVVETAALVELRALKYRTRILIEKGVTLYGIMDETGFLQEGQIYCVMEHEPNKKTVLVGEMVLITRSPALHPGDVQRAAAVNVPKDSPLNQLTNCICFSQKGKRDLPSQLSGGDLDGDLYNIIWDPAALPQLLFPPADYPRQEPIDIGRCVDRNDMTGFFIDFMATDQLGRIANLHQILADQRKAGTADPDCVKLAKMHSTAVDFSKTGIKVCHIPLTS